MAKNTLPKFARHGQNPVNFNKPYYGSTEKIQLIIGLKTSLILFLYVQTVCICGINVSNAVVDVNNNFSNRILDTKYVAWLPSHI